MGIRVTRADLSSPRAFAQMCVLLGEYIAIRVAQDLVKPLALRFL